MSIDLSVLHLHGNEARQVSRTATEHPSSQESRTMRRELHLGRDQWMVGKLVPHSIGNL